MFEVAPRSLENADHLTGPPSPLQSKDAFYRLLRAGDTETILSFLSNCPDPERVLAEFELDSLFTRREVLSTTAALIHPPTMHVRANDPHPESWRERFETAALIASSASLRERLLEPVLAGPYLCNLVAGGVEAIDLVEHHFPFTEKFAQLDEVEAAVHYRARAELFWYRVEPENVTQVFHRLALLAERFQSEIESSASEPTVIEDALLALTIALDHGHYDFAHSIIGNWFSDQKDTVDDIVITIACQEAEPCSREMRELLFEEFDVSTDSIERVKNEAQVIRANRRDFLESLRAKAAASREPAIEILANLAAALA